MIDHALPSGLNRGPRPVAPTETVEKIFSPFIPRSLLISLDSDEIVRDFSNIKDLSGR